MFALRIYVSVYLVELSLNEEQIHTLQPMEKLGVFINDGIFQLQKSYWA